MTWKTVNFGMWAGRGYTLPQVLIRDPDWFFWAIEDKVFPINLIAPAQKLSRRAKNIVIPERGAVKRCVAYVIGTDGKLHDAYLIRRSQGPHVGSSRQQRMDVLDLSFARRLMPYDKAGSAILIKRLRQDWFGGKVLTKPRVEAFFSEKDNFDLRR